MLALIDLVVFEVIVALKLGVASSHRVCSFQQVVAKESVAGFNHAGVLGFEIARLMLCPHKAGILGNGSLRSALARSSTVSYSSMRERTVELVFLISALCARPEHLRNNK